MRVVREEVLGGLVMVFIGAALATVAVLAFRSMAAREIVPEVATSTSTTTTETTTTTAVPVTTTTEPAGIPDGVTGSACAPGLVWRRVNLPWRFKDERNEDRLVVMAAWSCGEGMIVPPSMAAPTTTTLPRKR